MNTIHPFRLSRRSYGFRLNSGFCRPEASCSIQVCGWQIRVDDSHYLRVERPGQTIFFGTHHNGAYYFTVEARKEGIVTGRETFIHFDRAVHPDNEPLTSSIAINNYISALAAELPDLTYWFLHPDDGLGSCADWEGMRFVKKGAILEAQIPDGGMIASFDLDLFSSVAKAKEKALIDKILEFAQKAKVTMIFTSPGFIEEARAASLAQTMASRLT